ncbi:MAG: OpgC domain-containing protein [Pseudotabrizicola sp.]|uniref:OpgC family protein n=1 Tax=Pseudotabrizicola sp. TaxID=2939647 RepID=UPI002717E629|nr:OpgC domain-containing protein [Pseudotabrizicola sp.]MDO9637031.1 OpgC domain-containing protein [Pseudotabrizicola sp.]
MPEQAAHRRDYRVDLLRGIALMMIFINHIPGTLWEHATSRNFGFSDAAEGFVLMSGIATALAYGPIFMRDRYPPLALALRPWRRVLTLWWVHVLVVLGILALFYLTVHDPEVAAMAVKRNIARALADPVTFVPALMALSHQFAYADILPLYIALLLAAPLVLAAGVRWPRGLMLASLLLWLVVGIARIRVPTWPLENGWFFNPLAWQVIFVAGVLTGLAMRQGRRWLPVRIWPFWLAVAYLCLAAIWVQVPAVAGWGGHTLWMAHEYLGAPGLFTSFDKSFVHLPRLLHILALAYVLSALPALTRLAESPKLAPLITLGQHALPVFAASTGLAYVAQVVKVMAGPSFLLDTALIGGGFMILFALAGWLGTRKTRRAALPVDGRV